MTKQFHYFKVLWDNRLKHPGNWLAISAYKHNFIWFWRWCWTPHKSNKTWFHCYIHTPIFNLHVDNNTIEFGPSFFKYQFSLTYHR